MSTLNHLLTDQSGGNCSARHNPTIAETINGGADAETLTGGNGDDVIDGNGGADLMIGGNGRDLLIWDPGDGSDILDGGNGVDTHLFNTSGGAEVINLFAQGEAAILTRSLGGITMRIDDVERVVIGPGGGDDKITVGDLRGTDVRQVSAEGGAGADTLDASAFAGPHHLSLSGGDGFDRFVFSAGADNGVDVVDFQAHAGAADGDVIQLLGVSDASFAEALANHHLVQAGSDIMILDASGIVATLRDVSLASLSAADFLFG